MEDILNKQEDTKKAVDDIIKELKSKDQTYWSAKKELEKARKEIKEARDEAAETKREADYKVAQERCDGLAGSAKDACQASAKARYNVN